MMKFGLMAGVALSAGMLNAGVIFSNAFDSGTNANDAGWYFRGSNLTTGNGTISNGNMVLSNTGVVPASGSGVWRPFNATTIANGETMRLTVNVSGVKASANGYGLTFGIVSSSTSITSDGANISVSAAPRFAYQIDLPRNVITGGIGGASAAHTGFSQLYYQSAGTPAFQSQQLSNNQVGPNGAVDANGPKLAAVSSAQTFFVNAANGYSSDAVLVFELKNTGGQMSFGGSFTAPNGGGSVTFLNQDATLFDQATFDKIYIGSKYWGTSAADLSEVRVNSVSLEVIPEPATLGLFSVSSVGLLMVRRLLGN
jgi:hypothetical protein